MASETAEGSHIDPPRGDREHTPGMLWVFWYLKPHPKCLISSNKATSPNPSQIVPPSVGVYRSHSHSNHHKLPPPRFLFHNSPLPPLSVRCGWKTTISKAGSRSSTISNYGGALNLGLLVFRTMRSNYAFLKPPGVWYFLKQQLKLTRTST
jgi:hypothetical protein